MKDEAAALMNHESLPFFGVCDTIKIYQRGGIDIRENLLIDKSIA